ncbi:helix-turn-helix domain-containing protein [Pseudosulfitobacter sp. DSM 107133]|uniref:helix-turn-helix domain-containing protein n=1 Tax=Pseudosulfitobacter sp. DSM 107133 TaxID=2883100 RepID=UPI000DF26823|nr:helix-turn-helix domain-containing protein [Pseudosulfitobacter sp. DSM 107133]UOA27779.1 HTH-type transcriptional regulator RamB [Pseudosulfitobacter sp. DSM 107133]
MIKDSLTGSRIRERRVISGLKQADLARQIGISASYLNLIEHNRRRIGGKLLLNIAHVLGVEPSALTEGAEAALIASLREAASDVGLGVAEIERVEEFAGRFPGWAEVLAGAHRRVLSLERTVETLSDRLTHDPQLATSMHEVLSTAAAIRSTASILAEDNSISPDWQARFHANIDQDSRRLADSAKALVTYLDANPEESAHASPQEEVDAFLEAYDYRFDGIEAASQSVDAVLADAPQLVSVAAQHLARQVLSQIEADARAVSNAALAEQVAQVGTDPVALAQHFGCSVARILRRLAAQPDAPRGLVVCDRAGSLVFRRPVEGFSIPRFGACCPLWPLFQVLQHPGQVLRERIQQQGRNVATFDCFAVAEPVGPAQYNAPQLVHATMLILPVSAQGHAAGRPVGSTCRVCPRDSCAGRREPSILSAGF